MTDPAQMLTDISRWLPLLGDAHAAILGLHTPRLAPATSASRRDTLPFHLASTLDQLDDGAPGARSERGILDVLRMWSDSIADLRHEPHPRSAILHLASTADWWQDDANFADAASLTDDITTLWTTLAKVTGHTDQTDSQRRCPSCGGTLTRTPSTHGLSDHTRCTHCAEEYQDDQIADAVRRHTIVSVTGGEHWVSRQQVADLYPRLDRRTLHTWVTRGHVRKNGTRYHLGDLNARARRLSGEAA